MRWLVGVASAIVVLGVSTGAKAATYLGTVSGSARIESNPPTCGPEHSRFSYNASLASFQGPRDPFEIVSGSGGMIQGQGAKGYAGTGSGTYVLDPCDEAQSPGCSTGLKRWEDGSYGQVFFDVEGQTVKATAIPFDVAPTSNACGGIGSLGEVYALGEGSFPLSMVGARTITVSLTKHESNGTYTYDGSGTLTLRLVSNQPTLKELGPSSVTVGHRGGFTAVLLPPGRPATYTWEMKRSGQSQWTTLGTSTTPRFPYTFRVAGHFRSRVTARIAGSPVPLVSVGPPLEVRFPTRDQILASHSVVNFTRDAWRTTLRLATPLRRQELGFWIKLDTCSLTYGHTPTILGPPVDSRTDAEVNLGPRPPDSPSNPGPVKGCASYMVTTFHTHTPTTHRTPLTHSRPVGPSSKDEKNARNRKMPGFVYDYIASPPGKGRIPFGHPKNEPARIYRYGEFRRPTPQ